MSAADLADRIRLGEDSTLELKSIEVAGQRVMSPDRHDVADELAAMANGRGGTVVLGVDDRTREVLGIPLDGLDVVEGWVREICNDSVNPPLAADIHMMDRRGDGVPIIRDECEQSSGCLPEYSLLDDSELRLVIRAAG